MSNAAMAQLVEHILGKDEVTGSSPVISSKDRDAQSPLSFFMTKNEKGLEPVTRGSTIKTPKTHIFMRISGFFFIILQLQNPFKTPLHSAKVCKKCVKLKSCVFIL